MAVIYLEDILNRIGNKYLAVNVAAQRARELNEKGISMLLMGNAPKPVTVALEELVAGKLAVKALDQASEHPEELLFQPFSASDEGDDDDEVLEEFQQNQEYFDDSNLSDPDEPEEGL